MSTKPMVELQLVHQEEPKPYLNFAQRAILRRGHPRYIIIGVVGGIWTFYFLWLHDWIWAVTTLAVSAISGRAATSGVKERKFAETTLGKIMLLHLHPVNILIQLGGVGALVYGVWMHSPVVILAAASVILIGHLWGWPTVHDAL